MSNHHISLPEDIYNSLLTKAQESGTSPVDWIASQLSAEETEQEFSPDISDLIGAIDSRIQPKHSDQQSPFGQAVATKLADQGIHLP